MPRPRARDLNGAYYLVATKAIQHSQRAVKIGRPSQYTPELMLQIAKCVGKGMRLNEAASKYRIPYPTVEEWAKAHVEFNDEIAYAQAIAIESQLDKLLNSDDPRCAQFWLERCTLDKQRFCDPRVSQQINLQLNQLGEGAIHCTVNVLEDAQRQLNAIQAIPDRPGQLNPMLPQLPAGGTAA